MEVDNWSAISRRELLVGAAAAGLAMGGTGAAHSANSASPQSELTDVPDALTLYRKLRYRTDTGLVFWWLRGIKYGQIGAELTPLYMNHVGTVMRIRPDDDGGMAVTSLEITLPTALDWKTLLDEWTNPYTGEVLPVSIRPVGPTTVQYDSRGAREFPTELGGARLEVSGQSEPPTIVGGEVFMSEIVRAKVFRPERKTPYMVNDISSYHGKLSELSDPAITSVRATVAFAEVTGWQNWMKMGDRDGTLTSRTVGSKVASYQEMPLVWRDAVANKLPELAAQLEADPDGVLDRKAAEFKR